MPLTRTDVWFDGNSGMFVDDNGTEYTKEYIQANPIYFNVAWGTYIPPQPETISKPEASQVYQTFVPTQPTSAVPKDSTDMLIDYLNQNAVDSLQTNPLPGGAHGYNLTNVPHGYNPDGTPIIINTGNVNPFQGNVTGQTATAGNTTIADATELRKYIGNIIDEGEDNAPHGFTPGGSPDPNGGGGNVPPTTPDPYAGMSATDRALLEILNKLTAPSGGSPSGAIGIPSIEKPDSRLSPYEMLAIKTGSKLLTLIKDLPPDQQLEIVHDKYTKLLLAKRLKYERSLENGGYQKKQGRRMGTQQQRQGGKRSYRKKANYRQA